MFSIAIPAYKSDYLYDCIQSILNQSYADFELIIVNDCSPEPVDEIVAKFTDSRIRYFKNETNIGGKNLVDNWNNCLNMATREFFVMMGDDDKLDPDFFTEFAALIAKYPNLDVYHCRSRIINSQGEFIGLSPSCPEFESVYDNIWHRLNGHRLQFISDFVYRTASLKQTGGYFKLPYAWGSDEISAFIACGQKGIAHTNKPVFQYRKHATSISSSGSQLIKMDAVMAQSAWYDAFLKLQPINIDDQIQYQVLKKTIKKLMQKKKTVVLTNALEGGITKNFFRWFTKRNQYGYSVFELGYAAIESIKRNIAKSRFKN
ncbi:glycosyltransferase family 2 protein [Mucilaginibacter psychrotolerans]|uniref:Glycosyltransferase n=1 Tax=Mucilaginibacter psychrotolerans TaxID=1524096 RepID=A0A4Y8SJE5_9SPHI|nr:glycosyltransferase [Mucilaginibacter psychrotolerans]TFF38790.1 glycosyltransferase [Mucilaginibacter psychrotolerans]